MNTKEEAVFGHWARIPDHTFACEIKHGVLDEADALNLEAVGWLEMTWEALASDQSLDKQTPFMLETNQDKDCVCIKEQTEVGG
jgi:hypothetical protein